MCSVDDYLYDGETVCIGRKGTIDKPQFHSGKIWTVDTLFYTYGFKDIVPKYLYYVFTTIDWKSKNEATGVPSLSKTVIENIEFYCPNCTEQERTASILTDLDNEITSIYTEIEKIENIKSGLMDEFFNNIID